MPDTVWGVVVPLAVVVGLLAGIAQLAPSVRRMVGGGLTRVRKWWSTRWTARRAAQRQKAHKACIAEKTAAGQVVPIRHDGHLPTKVTYSDGNISYFFRGDMAAYSAAMSSGRHPLQRTFHGAPPDCPCGPAAADI